ncbi:MAG: hypothetical protein HN929_07230, partial [Chloroflexi bacterium]|nr:hypothetical protein [Chloroflexota bacterium]
MISAVNIKEIKRKVYSAHFEDGLWDILLGVFIMVISASGGPILWPGVLPLFCYTVGYLGISRIRQVTTYPRTGYVKNPEKRRVPVILVMLI